MEEYRKLAQQRYNQQKEKEEEERKRKEEEEEQKRKEEEKERKLKEEEEQKKRFFLERQFLQLTSCTEYDKSISDDELLFNLTCILETLENLEGKIDESQKNNICEIITKFILKVDSVDKKRDISVAKIFTTYFKEICRILDLSIEINPVDTSRDEIIAAELAHNFQKPEHLNNATLAAVKRQKATKEKDENINTTKPTKKIVKMKK